MAPHRACTADAVLGAGRSTQLSIESSHAEDTSAALLLIGRDRGASGAPIVTTYKIRNEFGTFSLSATDVTSSSAYDAFNVVDERLDLSDIADPDSNLTVRVKQGVPCAHTPAMAMVY